MHRRFAGIAWAALTATLLVGCVAEQPQPDVGTLRLQVECDTTDGFFAADAPAWFGAAGFSEVRLGATENIVSQLSRGQILVGIMLLSTAAEAILVQAQPLIVVGVLPETNETGDPYACLLDQLDEETEPGAEAETDEGVGLANPYVIVTTRDVLLDQPDALRAMLAAEALARNSTLGGIVSAETSDEGAGLTIDAAAQLSELSQIATALGYPLGEDRLLSANPLQQALDLSTEIHLPANIQ